MKKAILSVLAAAALVLGVSVPAWSDICVSVVGGTYAAGNDSTGAVWGDVTCDVVYDDIHQAIDSTTGTGDDVVWLDPTDNFTQTSIINTSGSPKTAGSLTLKSVGEDDTACFITGFTGASGLFVHNDANYTMDIRGITFRNHTLTTDGVIISVTQGGDFSLSKCTLDNLQVSMATAGNGPILMINKAGITATLNDIEIRNCAYTAVNVKQGAFIGTVDDTVSLVISDINMHDNTIEATTSGNIKGALYAEGGLTLSGTNYFQDNTVIGAGSNTYGMLYVANALTMSGSTEISGNVITTNNGDLQGAVALLEDIVAGTITGTLTVHDNTVSIGTGNPVGFFVIYGNNSTVSLTGTANGVTPSIEFYDNMVPEVDGIIAASQGGVIHLTRVSLHDNTMLHGAIRLGGWAHGSTIQYCLIYSNTADPSTGNGGGIYHMLQSYATEHTTHTVRHNLLWNNTAANGDQLFIGKSIGTGCGGGQCELTVNYHNNIIGSVSWVESAVNTGAVGSNNPVINFYTNDVEGGESGIDGAVDVYLGNLNADPLFTSLGIPSPGSPTIDSGTILTDAPTRDAAGNFYWWGTAPDIGPYERMGAGR